VFLKVLIFKTFKISEEVFHNCCKGSPNIFSRVVMVNGKYLFCDERPILGPSKILALNFSVPTAFPYLKTVPSTLV